MSKIGSILKSYARKVSARPQSPTISLEETVAPGSRDSNETFFYTDFIPVGEMAIKPEMLFGTECDAVYFPQRKLLLEWKWETTDDQAYCPAFMELRDSSISQVISDAIRDFLQNRGQQERFDFRSETRHGPEGIQAHTNEPFDMRIAQAFLNKGMFKTLCMTPVVRKTKTAGGGIPGSKVFIHQTFSLEPHDHLVRPTFFCVEPPYQETFFVLPYRVAHNFEKWARYRNRTQDNGDSADSFDLLISSGYYYFRVGDIRYSFPLIDDPMSQQSIT